MISEEFSKYASSYEVNNDIQNQVVKKLLTSCKIKPKVILDLGCGSGAVCKAINWHYDKFVGVDFADGMLALHPKNEKIELIYGDFNNPKLFKKLTKYPFETIFSSSALQWAEELETVLKAIDNFHIPIYLAIFTSNTFKTLHQTAKLSSLLMKQEDIEVLQKKIFPQAKFEVVTYRMEFKSTREMFRYIKQSGVSGARKLLSYKQTKYLMKHYPLNYLEFEVAFITT